MIRGFHNTSFTVADIERSLGFYRDLLGMEVVNYRREATAAYLSEEIGFPIARLRVAFLRPAPGAVEMLELIEYLEPRGTVADVRTCNVGAGHVCVLTDDLHSLFRMLSEAGVTFRSKAPVYLPSGPNQGGYSVYCLDPDGITVELFQPPKPEHAGA